MTGHRSRADRMTGKHRSSKPKKPTAHLAWAALMVAGLTWSVFKILTVLIHPGSILLGLSVGIFAVLTVDALARIRTPGGTTV